MVRAAVAAVAAVMIVAAAARAVAEPAPLAVDLALSPCAGEVAPAERLVGLLEIELAATLEQPIALAVAGADAGTNDADVHLSLDCSGTRDVLDLQIQRREPPGTYRGQVNLVQLSERMRPRTIALAIAENLRWLDAPRPAPEPKAALATTPPPTPTPSLTLAPSPPLRNPVSLRLARNWTIGLGVSSAVLTIIGGPLLGAGTNYHPPDLGLLASGSVMVTLAVAAFAGTGVSFGYWLRERLRPLPPAR